MKVQITLVPGLEEKVRQLAVSLKVEADGDAPLSPIGELISLLLPDLVDNALAGDLTFSNGDGSMYPANPAPDPDVAAAIAEASAKLEEAANPSQGELTIQEPDALPSEGKPELLTFAEMEASDCLPAALAWAKGNPAKEKALAETIMAMPPSMWSWSRTLELAQRTYELRSTPGDV